MAEPQIRFYIDESVDPELATQLRRRGVIAYSTRDLGKLGASDDMQLETALSLNAVLVTHDIDFIQIAFQRLQEGRPCPGILHIKEQMFSIGFLVRLLEKIAFTCTAQDFQFPRYLQEFRHLLHDEC
jgi:predicted nuclease of predicted toxin-antitoxin system